MKISNANLSALSLATLVCLSALGCGGAEHELEEVSEPESANSEAARNSSTSESSDDPDEVDASMSGFYSTPLPDRCAGTGASRCDADFASLEERMVSNVTRISIPEPVGDCSNSSEDHDGLACLVHTSGLEESGIIPPTSDDLTRELALDIVPVGDGHGIEVWKTEMREDTMRIDRSGILAGARSRWGFDDVELVDGTVRASEGVMAIETGYWGFPLTFVVRDASLVGSTREVDGTTFIEDAELAGFVEPAAIVAELEETRARCDLEAELQSDTRIVCPGSNTPYLSESCQNFAQMCIVAKFWAESVADLDRDENGWFDALTVRFDIELEPATLVP